MMSSIIRGAAVLFALVFVGLSAIDAEDLRMSPGYNEYYATDTIYGPNDTTWMGSIRYYYTQCTGKTIIRTKVDSIDNNYGASKVKLLYRYGIDTTYWAGVDTVHVFADTLWFSKTFSPVFGLVYEFGWYGLTMGAADSFRVRKIEVGAEGD